MLQKQRKIRVAVTKCNWPQWKQLFAGHSKEHYSIMTINDMMETSTGGPIDLHQLEHFVQEALPYLNQSGTFPVLRSLSEQDSANSLPSFIKDQDWFLKTCEHFGLTHGDPFYLFIDDGLSEEWIGGSDALLIPVFLMLACCWLSPKSIVWAAVDPNQVSASTYASYGAWITRFKNVGQLIKQAGKNGYCAVTLLKQVMRCAEHVFNSTYLSLVWPRLNFVVLEVEQSESTPVLGHKIIGVKTFVDKIKGENYEDGVEKFAVKVKEAMQDLEQGLKIETCAVIVTGGALLAGNATKLKKAVLHQMKITFHGKGVQMITDNETLESNWMTVAAWSDVYSKEWPVVVHACFLTDSDRNDSSENAEGRKFEKYIAKSRAVSALIDIEVHIP